MDTRGVSPILGFVLLVGMVAAVSVSLLVVGGQMMTEGQQQVEEDRVEQSFVELSKTIASTSTNSDSPKSMTLEAGEQGAIAREATGSYTITVENETVNKTVGNGTIGTIEYKSDDGTTIAYEAGAVFRETGAETRVISEPPFHYDRDTNTLNLPVTTTTEEKELSSGDLVVNHKSATRNTANYVKNYRVYIEIQSDYCKGWERYFSDQTGYTAITEGCAEGAANTVNIRLGYAAIEDAFSDGVSLPNGEDSITGDEKKNPFDDVAANDFPSLDGTIDLLVSDAEDGDFTNISDSPVTGDRKLDDGKYYAKGINEGSLTFDLSDGNATLVMNGSIQTQNKDDGITVSDCGDGNQLQVYVTGDIDMKNGGTIAPNCDDDGSVTTIQVYGKSGTDVRFDKGNAKFMGLLYVPGGEVDFQGSPDFDGAIVAESINIKSKLNGVTSTGVDSSTIDAIPSGYEPAPQITYLNVINHRVDIRTK